jgi:RNA polymerase sigma-70 factor, ECF subfamily
VGVPVRAEFEHGEVDDDASRRSFSHLPTTLAPDVENDVGATRTAAAVRTIARDAEEGESVESSDDEFDASGPEREREAPPENLRPAGFEELIERLKAGDEDAGPKLFEILYAQLHRLAKHRMSKEAHGHTLQPTALLNEAYLRLFGRESPTFQNLEHFLSLIARAMRSVLVDHARKKKTKRRSAPGKRVDEDELFVMYENNSVDILELDAALDRLRAFEERGAQMVELRFFVGLTIEEISKLLKVSDRTTERDLKTAKAWLAKELSR